MEQLSASQPLSPTLAMFRVFWERLLGRRGSPGRKLRKKPGGPQHSFSPLAQPFPCPTGSAGAGPTPLLAAPLTFAIFTCLFYDFNF